MEDYCSTCARSFPAEELTEKGSELLCSDCVSGKKIDDPEARAMAEHLGKTLHWPAPVDMAVTILITLTLAVGWAFLLAPRSAWWALFLAAAPASSGGWLRVRADLDNNATMLWAIILGAALPVVGFLALLIGRGEALWIALFLIPFGAAVGLVSTIGRHS